MDKKSLIDAGSNSYVYSDINKCFLFIPDDIKDVMLGKGKDQILVKYAMQGITNQLFVSRYQLYLPDKEQLQKELGKLLENE